MWVLRGALIAAMVMFPATSFHADTFPVTKTADTDDGTCDPDCSLREAIGAANANAGPDDVPVPAGNYLLTLGQLHVTDELSIAGGGQANTVIDGNATDRIFEIPSGVVTEISDITIQNGAASSGGGIISEGDLTLINSTVSGNTAIQFGGGIYNLGTASLTNSSVSGNLARFGGGIDNEGTLTLTNSTVSSNTVSRSGGGIWSYGGMTITNGIVSGNTAPFYGGGIYSNGTADITGSTLSDNYGKFGGAIDNEDSMSLTNSTISTNDAFSGGGIYNTRSLALYNTTVALNTASYAGAIRNTDPQGPDRLETESTIFAENSSNLSSPCSPDPFDSLGYNLSDDSSCVSGGAGDQLVADARLGALANNGGPTETHDLLSDSPAIDSGNDATCPATDQRGITRPADGDDDDVAHCDVGAVEFVPEPVGWLMLVSGIGLMGVLRRSRCHSVTP
jgi:CSLREA domain-containing protein